MQFPAEIILQERKFILEGEKFDKTGNYVLHNLSNRTSKMREFFNNEYNSRNEYVPGYIMPSKKMLVVSYGTAAKTRTKTF